MYMGVPWPLTCMVCKAVKWKHPALPNAFEIIWHIYYKSRTRNLRMVAHWHRALTTFCCADARTCFLEAARWLHQNPWRYAKLSVLVLQVLRSAHCFQKMVTQESARRSTPLDLKLPPTHLQSSAAISVMQFLYQSRHLQTFQLHAWWLHCAQLHWHHAAGLLHPHWCLTWTSPNGWLQALSSCCIL